MFQVCIVIKENWSEEQVSMIVKGYDTMAAASEGALRAFEKVQGTDERTRKLAALEMWGVDNWEGYSDAMEWMKGNG